jgi:hypothetical protein
MSNPNGKELTSSADAKPRWEGADKQCRCQTQMASNQEHYLLNPTKAVNLHNLLTEKEKHKNQKH